MPTAQTVHGQVWTGRAHRGAPLIAVDAISWIEVAVDEQDRQQQLSAVRGLARTSHVSVVLQAPRAG